MAILELTLSPLGRISYKTLLSIRRGLSTTHACHNSGQFHRSDFTSQPFTGVYEAGQPTIGPLGGTSAVRAPRITPRLLKDHLDQYVVGQERAKKVLSVAVYNHYQRIQELQRQDDEEQERIAQQRRREMGYRHPVEADEFPGQQPTINLYAPPGFQPHTSVDVTPLLDHTQLTIEKSNILLLGPSGVGKTLMAKTLARVLEVPFSMSDCTPFTQAGYIGEDAEVCVQRLLVAANFDVARAERGIICLDEIDKIATAKVTHGKDVSGEGVQQALLKIIEGTTLQIQSKQDRANAGRGSGGGPGGSHGGGYPSHNSYGSGMSPGQVGGKGDTFTVRTDNILFICTGAFIGLHKVILDRVSKGSIGFGAPVRSFGLSSDSNDTSIKGEDGLFRKHLPYFTPDTDSFLPNASSKHNTLDLVEPADLQKYGMIPELVGRIPISCALSSLDEDALVRVLTEPRNSLLRQYEQLFQLSGIELRLTSGALREVAKTAGNMGTGARGLRTVMERLLGEAMFEAPGSAIKHILITESVAQRKQAPIYLPRGQQHTFHRMIAAEEEVWARRQRDKDGSKPESGNDISKEGDGTGGQRFNTFEQYRDKAKVAGFS